MLKVQIERRLARPWLRLIRGLGGLFASKVKVEHRLARLRLGKG